MMARSEFITVAIGLVLSALTWCGARAQEPTSANAEFVKELVAHHKPILPQLAVAARANRFATLGRRDDNTLFVWDSSGGQILLGVETPTPLSRVLLTPDGGQVLAVPPLNGSQKFGIPRWDVATGRALEPLQPVDDQLPYMLASSPSGKYVAGLNGARLWIWRLKDGKVVFDKDLFAVGASLVFTPDNRAVIVGGPDGIYQYALPDGRLLTKYVRGNLPDKALAAAGRRTGEMKNVTSLILSPDGRYFAATFTLSQQFRVGYWQLGQALAVAEAGHHDEHFNRDLRNLQFTADGKSLLATSNFSGKTYRGDASGGVLFGLPLLDERGHFFTASETVLWTIAHKDPGHVLTIGDRRARRWKSTGEQALDGFALIAHETSPAAIVPVAGGRAVSFGADGKLCAWNLENGVLRSTQQPVNGSPPSATEDGKTLVYTDGTDLVVWDCLNWKEKNRIPLGKFVPEHTRVGSDGLRAICWQQSGRYSLVDLTSGSLKTGTLPIDQADRIQTVHSDLDTLLVTTKLTRNDAASSAIWKFSSAEKTLNLRSAQGENLKPLITDLPQLSVFSPDGKTLLTASETGKSVYLWDCETGRLKRRLTTIGLTDAAYARDGRLFALVGERIHSLNAATGELTDLSGDAKRKAGSVLAISRETGRAVTADRHGKLCLWELPK